jgi:hypothetical protein
MEAIRKNVSEESEAEIMDVMVSSEVHIFNSKYAASESSFKLFHFSDLYHSCGNLIAFIACFFF